MYSLCRKSSCLRSIWSLVSQNSEFTDFFPNSVYKYITYIFHMKQMWAAEPKPHGILETFADQKRSNVGSVMWAKGRNLIRGVLPKCCRTPCSPPWGRIRAGAHRLQLQGWKGHGCSSPCAHTVLLWWTLWAQVHFFWPVLVSLCMSKFALESVFYSYANHLKYLAQMSGY